jgi:hypothetical protein
VRFLGDKKEIIEMKIRLGDERIIVDWKKGSF